MLKDAKGILDELQAYKGAGQEIREVTSTYFFFFLKECDWQHRALKCEKKKNSSRNSRSLSAALGLLIGGQIKSSGLMGSAAVSTLINKSNELPSEDKTAGNDL